MTDLIYNSQEQFLYFEYLHDFFNKIENARIIVNVIRGKSLVTLRRIEWFLKRYSYTHKIWYHVDHPIQNQPPILINIHDQYIQTSKLYTTNKFDFFCRGVHLQVPIRDYMVETNIAQLNMFHWVITNNVIEYMENHHAEIIADMYMHSSTRKKYTKQRGPKTSKKPRLTPTPESEQLITDAPPGAADQAMYNYQQHKKEKLELKDETKKAIDTISNISQELTAAV